MVYEWLLDRINENNGVYNVEVPLYDLVDEFDEDMSARTFTRTLQTLEEAGLIERPRRYTFMLPVNNVDIDEEWEKVAEKEDQFSLAEFWEKVSAFDKKLAEMAEKLSVVTTNLVGDDGKVAKLGVSHDEEPEDLPETDDMRAMRTDAGHLLYATARLRLGKNACTDDEAQEDFKYVEEEVGVPKIRTISTREKAKKALDLAIARYEQALVKYAANIRKVRSDDLIRYCRVSGRGIDEKAVAKLIVEVEGQERAEKINDIRKCFAPALIKKYESMEDTKLSDVPLGELAGVKDWLFRELRNEVAW